MYDEYLSEVTTQEYGDNRMKKDIDVHQASLRVKHLLKGFSVTNDNRPIVQGCL